MEEFQVKMARKDPNAFAAYILSDEQTGKPIRQAPYHKRIQELMTQHDRLVIWGHVGLGKCVVDDTVFVLEDGSPVTCGTLRSTYTPGRTRVASLDTSTGELVYLPVKSIRYNGNVPVVTVTTDAGHQCTTTVDHPYYARRKRDEGWVYAHHLRPGDIVYTPHKIESSSTSWMNLDDAHTLGLLINLVSASPSVSGRKMHEPRGVVFGLTKSMGDALLANTLHLVRKTAEARGWVVTTTEQKRMVVVSVDGTRPFCKRMGIQLKPNTRLTDLGWIAKPSVVTEGQLGLPTQLLASGKHAILSFMEGLTFGRMQVAPGRQLGNIGKFPENVKKGVHWLLARCGFSHAVRKTGIVLGRDTTRTLVTRLASKAPGYYGLVLDGLEEHAASTPLFHARSDKRTWKPVRVRKVEPAGVMETWSVEIDGPNHTHLTDGLLTHNTQQISIARVLWEIGHNTNLRVVIVQATIGLAEGIVTSLKTHIESNPKVRKVFPHLKPGDEWTTTQFKVERTGNLKDPTVTAVGAEGNVLGRRIDLLIIDDALTLENTRLESRRASFLRWFQSTLMSRLEPGARVVFIGNAWDVNDAMHYYAKMSRWRAYKFPVRDPKTGKSLWPERWPQERIKAFAEDNPLEAARMLDCDASTDSGSRFRKQDLIDAIDAGRGMFGQRNVITHRDQLEGNWTIAAGVDLGLKKEVGADYTAITTWGLSPEGKKVILSVEKDRYTFEEIIDTIIDNHYRYGSTIFVESVAAQRFIVDAIISQAKHVPVAYFFTGGRGGFGNKNSSQYGIEALARDFAKHLVAIPASEDSTQGTETGVGPHIDTLLAEAKAYSAGKGQHTGDVLMSAWIGHQALAVAASGGTHGSIDIDMTPSPDGGYEPKEEPPTSDEVRRLAMKELFAEVLNRGAWPP